MTFFVAWMFYGLAVGAIVCLAAALQGEWIFTGVSGAGFVLMALMLRWWTADRRWTRRDALRAYALAGIPLLVLLGHAVAERETGLLIAGPVGAGVAVAGRRTAAPHGRHVTPSAFA